MALDEFGKDGFENRVGGSMINRPFIDGGTERRYTGPAAVAVVNRSRGERVKVEQAATERNSDRRLDQRWVVSSKVAQGAEWVGAADSVATLWREPLTIGRPMQNDARQAGSAISFGHGQVDECLCRLDQIPEHGR